MGLSTQVFFLLSVMIQGLQSEYGKYSLRCDENNAVCVLIFVVDVGIITLHSMYIIMKFQFIIVVYCVINIFVSS